jgi:methylthioribose-1-phosphate isomerase
MALSMSQHPETLHWHGALDGHVRMIEQTLLPAEHRVIEVPTVEDMIGAIRRLAVRGAPAIGVAAAYGVVLGIGGLPKSSSDEVLGAAETACDQLAKARPTAVNLFWALDRMRAKARSVHGEGATGAELCQALLDEALAIHASDRDTCRRIGEHGAALLSKDQTVLTHCNAGALATGGMGTALAPIYVAHEEGKNIKVYADETRPLLQGARITAWELSSAGIDVTVITDGMAARVMGEGRIDCIIVGSDRITRGGDVCNKIGTYGVAIAARHHGLPFYVAAPLSTVDASLIKGADIPIEERDPEEIASGLGRRITPEGSKIYNPAFDVTPRDLITAIITEMGVIQNPNQEKMEQALTSAGISF